MKALIICLILVATPEPSAWAAKAGNRQLARIFGASSKNRQTSAVFVRLKDRQVLYELNGNRTLTPASVTKIFTAAAVLNTFKPFHEFKTEFFHTGKRKGNVIHGDLVVVGDGDPFIVSEKLWQLAADFKLMGLKKITGNIIIDNSLFAGGGRDASRAFGAKVSTNAYDAPVSAFGINFNTIAVAVSPAMDRGQLAFVGLDPYPLRGVRVVNQVKTTKSASGKSFQVKRISNGKSSLELRLNGTIAGKNKITKVYRSVNSHLSASGEYLRSFLLAQGVSVQGAVKAGRRPAGATALYTLKSYPLTKIISGLNKYSNNYIADVLTKRLGAAKPASGRAHAPGSGSYANGLAAIKRFMKINLGIKTPFQLYNGSGLSPKNKLSAQHLTTLLIYMENNLALFPEFFVSLPAAGWDGTLKDRFGSKSTGWLKGKVRAKTGTLTEPVSASSLAGYLRHPKHGLVAFAIIQNGVQGKSQPSIASLRKSQEQSIDYLFRHM